MEDVASIPVIDIGALDTGSAAELATIAASIHRACADIGFFYVSRHGLSADVIDAAVSAATGSSTFPRKRSRLRRQTLDSGVTTQWQQELSRIPRSQTILPDRSGAERRRPRRLGGPAAPWTQRLACRTGGVPTGAGNLLRRGCPRWSQPAASSCCGVRRRRNVLRRALQQTHAADQRHPLPCPAGRRRSPPFRNRSSLRLRLHHLASSGHHRWTRATGQERRVDCGAADRGDARHQHWRSARTLERRSVRIHQHRARNPIGHERISIGTFYDPDFNIVVDPRDLDPTGTREPRFEPVVAGDHIAGRIQRSFGFGGKV